MKYQYQFETIAELAQKLLEDVALSNSQSVCQWCNQFVPDGIAYCDACYNMIIEQSKMRHNITGIKIYLNKIAGMEDL